MDNSDLVRRAKNNELEAITSLISRHQTAVYSICYSYLNNFENAQELAQDAFVTAFTKLAQLKDDRKFSSWLMQIARNLCVSRIRHSHTKRNMSAALSEDLGMSIDAAPDDKNIHRDNNLPEFIHSLFNALTPKQVEAVTLHYLDDMPITEIAAYLDATPSAIKSRLHAARSRIKEKLIESVKSEFESHPLPVHFTLLVIAEIISIAHISLQKYEYDTVVEQVNDTLEILRKVPKSPRWASQYTELLNLKAQAVRFPQGIEYAIPLWEESADIAEKWLPKKQYADKMMTLGIEYSNARKPKKAFESRERAYKAYSDIPDYPGMAEAKTWIGGSYFPNSYMKAKECFTSANQNFDKTKKPHPMHAVCKAALAVIDDLESDAVTGSIPFAGATCEIFKK
ncbi:MAG: sigma-70 family RNA polymerase sigma factor, partial [Spirochaetales bacterium]|nr:sigma-70 family RNA polymerase sigma factor [Spirochaetales bacterium]